MLLSRHFTNIVPSNILSKCRPSVRITNKQIIKSTARQYWENNRETCLSIESVLSYSESRVSEITNCTPQTSRIMPVEHRTIITECSVNYYSQVHKLNLKPHEIRHLSVRRRWSKNKTKKHIRRITEEMADKTVQFGAATKQVKWPV